MKIKLNEHFTYKKLFKFTLPSIAMMIFTSIYGVVDGLFVSNFVGEIQFTALNFIYPFIMILGTIGFMLGAGGSALVSKTLGEKNNKKANELFSLFIYISMALGIVISIIGIIILPNVAKLLGAEGVLLDNCILYGRIILIGNTSFILQQEFQSFFVSAEKPQLGFIVTISAGITNMILDALFVALFKWGLAGAALATIISQTVGGFLPILYFVSKKNNSILKLTKTQFDGKSLLKACTNGSSELMSNISMSLVGMLYNVQLMKYASNNGVAAYGVIMYVNFVFLAIFIGYSIGTAPLIGYNYGAKNQDELKNIFKKSLKIIAIFSLSMLVFSEVLAVPLSKLFVGYNEELFALTLKGFRIFSFSFLFAGIAIFGSSFFTALNNGLVSALISFLRTLVFQVLSVLLLPLIFKIDGIWYSIIVAEFMAFTVTTIFLALLKNKYKYL